ncbi:flagellar hook-length control protein FliK [Shewanella schlegeliana]|uniref:Flagellar hook-length control protein FliK n=1 Tax=Shewanella schlegeliana TaxID=190308 RepID=A0ABS1T340_9GAMM|nr:flagellar hook-length control protein FliK [Shewanella schlegeliana]MBL4915207.1 flagellar hook-length control protein FliK [Shewanella schlegeliana]MCL1111283.1 flagellar hook-length control protein FliK [Shewanella schlegeliana]GIU37833.1 flagellar hook-length control protein FliK [Shewanella schlegeliana]
MTSPVLPSTSVTSAATNSATSTPIKEASNQGTVNCVNCDLAEHDSFEQYAQALAPFSLIQPHQASTERLPHTMADLSTRGETQPLNQSLTATLQLTRHSNSQLAIEPQVAATTYQTTEGRSQTPAFLSLSQQALNQSQLATQATSTQVQTLDTRAQSLPLNMITSQGTEIGNTAATNGSFPLISGAMKPDSFAGFNPFQGTTNPFSTTLSANMVENGTSSAIDSVNQILATSSRTQSSVAQWGPVSVSQSAPLPQQSHEMLSPLREQLRFQIDQQIKQAELRLDPPELGKIELNVRLDGDRLHIQMHAANSSVRDALLMGLDRLRAELAMDHGGQIDVDINQGEPQQQKHQGSSQSAIASASLHESLASADIPQQDQVDLLA